MVDRIHLYRGRHRRRQLRTRTTQARDIYAAGDEHAAEGKYATGDTQEDQNCEYNAYNN